MLRTELAPGYSISRVIRGNWQLAKGHGALRSDDPSADLMAYAEAGITTFDCADIYTGVEETIGRFRQAFAEKHGYAALDRIQVHTKFVPDLDVLGTIEKATVTQVIDRSLKRLGVERLDLVQLHWWDFSQPRWIETGLWLDELRRAGKIRNVGATNFDAERMARMVDAGVPLVSMQVQYSLLDQRPAKRLAEAARQRGVSLLCYGTVAGGLLSDRWLGAPEPKEVFENRSLVKYKLIIDEWGGWDLFQALLRALRGVADRHGTEIAAVASAAALEWPHVAGVIVGARDRSHLPANLAVASVRLMEEDRRAIDAVLAESSPLPGEVYELERDRTGRHGAIMKYNLGGVGAAAQPTA
ncbi:MAG TPA: aldo/keto reductase [Mesorhizobium sp.]|jgi:aryl-alcohol dehydrogenase-like predicted oxidoreductase|nr:aldo/keto reductase [Mesorhizobium sp.]